MNWSFDLRRIEKKQRFEYSVVGAILCSFSFLVFHQEAAASPTDEPKTASSQPRDPPLNTMVISGTETFAAEFIGDNGHANEGAHGDDDNFLMFRNIFYFQTRCAEFDTGIRFDTTLFHYPPKRVPLEEFTWSETANGYTLLNYNHDFRLERIHGGFQVGRLHVTVGDFYATFGRGIALALAKVDDVGLDTGILGGRADYQVGDTLTVTVLGGVVNALNIDPVTHQVLEDDPLDRLAGARLEWRISRGFAVAGHGVLLSPRYSDESQISDDRLYVDRSPGIEARNVGGSTDIGFGDTKIFVEANYQSHDNFRPPEGLDDVMDEEGYAFFTEMSQMVGNNEIKLEGYLYHQWLMDGPYRGSAANLAVSQPIPYQKMVTLELPWMPVKSLGNATAGRLSWNNYIAPSGTELTAKALVVSNQGGLTPQGDWSDHSDILSFHPTTSINQTFKSSGLGVVVEGGYRHEWMVIEKADQGHLWHISNELTRIIPDAAD